MAVDKHIAVVVALPLVTGVVAAAAVESLSGRAVGEGDAVGAVVVHDKLAHVVAVARDALLAVAVGGASVAAAAGAAAGRSALVVGVAP